MHRFWRAFAIIKINLEIAFFALHMHDLAISLWFWICNYLPTASVNVQMHVSRIPNMHTQCCVISHASFLTCIYYYLYQATSALKYCRCTDLPFAYVFETAVSITSQWSCDPAGNRQAITIPKMHTQCCEIGHASFLTCISIITIKLEIAFFALHMHDFAICLWFWTCNYLPTASINVQMHVSRIPNMHTQCCEISHASFLTCICYY